MIIATAHDKGLSCTLPMRLWTLHPQYLDAQGLVALWREALLAQKVLQGRTTGYRHHPQLLRFRQTKQPVAAIASYLKAVHEEARRRDYQFDASKISRARSRAKLTETQGQLLYEWKHLKRKLRQRQPSLYRKSVSIKEPAPHPLFKIVPGPVQDWEQTY